MIDRKKKIKIIQLLLLFSGILIIYFTYYNKELSEKDNIISKSVREKVEKQNEGKESKESDVFFDIEYSGLDLNGNRYLLKSEEAQIDETRSEIVYMNVVNATFYFKDDTILYVWSDTGIYNTKTLDRRFEKYIKAKYLGSELFAEKAEYSNSENYLSIYENVKINDIKGNLIADKLLFDISSQELDITSFNNGKINANVNLNEKGFRILKFKKDKPIFEVQNVSKSFDGRPVFKETFFKSISREIVGVLGPNGCGKTTLFSMCIGEQNVEGGKFY